MSGGMRACTGGRGVEEEEEEGPWGPPCWFNANRLGKQSNERERGRERGRREASGKRGPVRHVKLTNRSGLAGFRIPRVIGRDPVAPSGTVVSPRFASFRESGVRAPSNPFSTHDAHPHTLAVSWPS